MPQIPSCYDGENNLYINIEFIGAPFVNELANYCREKEPELAPTIEGDRISFIMYISEFSPITKWVSKISISSDWGLTLNCDNCVYDCDSDTYSLHNCNGWEVIMDEIGYYAPPETTTIKLINFKCNLCNYTCVACEYNTIEKRRLPYRNDKWVCRDCREREWRQYECDEWYGVGY